MKFPSKEIVERIRREYPAGTRVELVQMDDAQAPPIGTKGTVVGVDDTASIMVRWDNGSGLHVVYGEDRCRKITKWLLWEELTDLEKEQARNSYVYLRGMEEETGEENIDSSGVLSCRFERMDDGYIYVDL